MRIKNSTVQLTVMIWLSWEPFITRLCSLNDLRYHSEFVSHFSWSHSRCFPCSWKDSSHRSSLPTLQHEEPDHPVQVDVLMLPLEEGCSPGEAAQDVIDHLGLRPGHCGKQSQRRGQLEPRCTHVLTRIDPVWRLRDGFLWQKQGKAQGGWADSPLTGEESREAAGGKSRDVREAITKSKLPETWRVYLLNALSTSKFGFSHYLLYVTVFTLCLLA